MAPSHQKNNSASLPDQTLVVDNGAFTIKAGFTTASPDPDKDCRVISNCIARSRDKRIYVGAELDRCIDFGEMVFRRPVEKGYLVNWEAEKEIWERTFFDKDARLKCDPHETNLILTEAPNAPQTLQTNCDQMVFEDFEFASYYRCIGPVLNAFNDIPSLFSDPPHDPSLLGLPVECLLLIDSGYSHTTVTPLIYGRPVHAAVRRLDIGGKFLTNYLKEAISLRHYGLMDEPHLVNEIKEDVGYVTSEFSRDLERTWKGGAESSTRKKTDDDGGGDGIVLDYVLPDYSSPANIRGFSRPHDPSRAATLKRLGAAPGPREDFFPLGNERFVVPEILFSPRDVGMKEDGIPGVVIQSLNLLPQGLWPAMLGNIVVVGGNSLFPGFMERLQADIRQHAPSEYVVRVARSPDPIKSTWLGGARMASNRDTLKSFVVTKAEYEEHGSNSGWLLRQFASKRAS